MREQPEDHAGEETVEESADPSADEVVGPDVEHDESGLDLARLISRSLASAPGLPAAARRTARQAPRRRRTPRVSGAHADDRDPQKLDVTVGRLVEDLGWTTDLSVHGVFGRWPELVGAEVAEHCTPESFAEGRLVVRTDSTAWATQLRLLAPTVVRRLNEELGDGTVTFIDVQGPLAPSWKKGRLSAPGRGPRDTYG